MHLQSFASDIFFHLQTGETTNKFFPFEMSMTISDVKIRIDISHSHVQPRRKMAFKGLIISINQHFTWAYWKKTVRANLKKFNSKIEMDPNFKILFFGGSRSSLTLALVLEVEGPESLSKKKLF